MFYNKIFNCQSKVLMLAYNSIENTKNNIAVTRLAALQKTNHRKYPKLKQTIGMRCRIGGKDNKVLHIITKGQELPFVNEVKTQTASIIRPLLFVRLSMGTVRKRVRIHPY